MPFHFDLSAGLQPPPQPEKPVHPPFDFRIGQPIGLVRRAAALPVLTTATIGAVVSGVDDELEERCQPADSDQHDQFSVRSGSSLCFAVLCRNATGRQHPRSLLGSYGHVERLSAWVHLIAALAFCAYATLRPILVTNEHTTTETWTTAAAAAVAACFACSTFYHVSAPSKTISYYTRQLDYISVYVAIAVGGLADFAIATNGFVNTNILSISDGPLAALFVSAFFLVRRLSSPADATWSSWLGGCTLSLGLFRRGHTDGLHTGARQATSFLLAISYFVTIPSILTNFGVRDGLTIVIIELIALAMLLIGMVADNGSGFPDKQLASARGPRFLVCTPCGCIGTSHALWHVLSVVAAAHACAAREYALSQNR